MEERTHRVYRSLHKPLLYLGVERKMFGAIVMAAAILYIAAGSIRAGSVVLVLGILAGRYVCAKDPIYFQVLLQSSQFRSIYDAAKHEVKKMEIRHNA
jgi:type IV secretory pathway VirB3-like protein